MKNEKLKILFMCGLMLMSVAMGDDTANQSNVNSTATSNVTNTPAINNQNSGQQQNAEAVNNFFKDSDYEHFAPEKNYEYVDPQVLEQGNEN